MGDCIQLTAVLCLPITWHSDICPGVHTIVDADLHNITPFDVYVSRKDCFFFCYVTLKRVSEQIVISIDLV